MTAKVIVSTAKVGEGGLYELALEEEKKSATTASSRKDNMDWCSVF